MEWLTYKASNLLVYFICSPVPPGVKLLIVKTCKPQKGRKAQSIINESVIKERQTFMFCGLVTCKTNQRKRESDWVTPKAMILTVLN